MDLRSCGLLIQSLIPPVTERANIKKKQWVFESSIQRKWFSIYYNHYCNKGLLGSQLSHLIILLVPCVGYFGELQNARIHKLPSTLEEGQYTNSQVQAGLYPCPAG